MITPSQIVAHLKTYLPIFTDLFTVKLTITAATISAGNVLNVTSAASHGMSAGDVFVLSVGTARNPLTSAVLVDDDYVKFTTVYDHDLTKPNLPLDDQTLTLGGFSSVWDGEHIIVDVPNRRNFTVALPTGETAAPTVDESQYLMESITAGVYTVLTVPDTDNFTADLSALPELATGTVDDLSVITGFRIAAAANFTRASEIYAEQATGEPYLFVIMTDADVSKDRHTLNDAVAGFTNQDTNLLRILQSFSTTIFIPTTEDLSGADAQDIAYSTLFTALNSALFGYPFVSSLIKYRTVPSGHGPGEYNSAYYVHVYDWQAPFVIDYEDGFMQMPDYAFRDIVQTLQLFNDAEAEMIANINLDVDPL